MSVAVVSHDDADTVQPALPMSFRPPASPAAVSLLGQAKHGLAEAGRAVAPVERFTTAYLSALRAAAGVLAARGRPHRGRARPASTWVLLESAAPELKEWAVFFAANSATQAAAQAGITRRVTVDAADELYRQACEFVELARHAIQGGAAERKQDSPPPPARARAVPCAKGGAALRRRSAGQRQGELDFPVLLRRAPKRSRSG